MSYGSGGTSLALKPYVEIKETHRREIKKIKKKLLFSPRWPGYAASSRRIAILSCLPTGSLERDKVTVQSQVINFTTTQGTLSHQTPQSFKHNTPLVISHKAPCKWQGQNNRGMQGARPAPYNHRHTGEISLIAQIIMRESVCVQKVRWDIFFFASSVEAQCFPMRSVFFPSMHTYSVTV